MCLKFVLKLLQTSFKLQIVIILALISNCNLHRAAKLHHYISIHTSGSQTCNRWAICTLHPKNTTLRSISNPKAGSYFGAKIVRGTKIRFLTKTWFSEKSTFGDETHFETKSVFEQISPLGTKFSFGDQVFGDVTFFWGQNSSFGTNKTLVKTFSLWYTLVVFV